MTTSKAKADTHVLDEGNLVPLLKQMDRVTDVETLKQMADSFLQQCRFAADKVASCRRDLAAMTSAKRIQLFCWNVLLSGQGHSVIRY